MITNTSGAGTPLQITSSNSNSSLLKLHSTAVGATVGLDFLTYGGTGKGVSAKIAALDVAGFKGSLAFYTNNNGIVNDANPTERMRITNNGNVGIGSLTPNAPLQFANTSQNRKIVLNEQVNNDHQFYGFGINAGILRYQVAGTEFMYGHVFYAGSSASGSVELMRIRGDGNVGIGTSSPTTKLDVVGGIKSMNILVNSYIQIGSAPKNGSGVLLIPGTDFGLSVKNKIYCTELNVTVANTHNWADFVFSKGYKLESVEEVEKHIKQNGHLKNIPSANELIKTGYDVTKMDAALLRKIEEMMLYIIAQEKRIKELESKK